MALISLPTGGIKSAEWTMPEWAGFTVKSGWTGKQTVGDLGSARDGWKLKLEIVPMRVAQLNLWRAFFAQMKGPVNTCVVSPVETPQTTQPNAQIDGGGQSGSTVNLRYFNPSITVLKAGQLISLGDSFDTTRLYVLTADLVSTPGSTSIASIYPPLAFPYADGSGVGLANPATIMRLTSSSLGWGVSPGRIYQPFSLEFEEIR